MCNAKDRCPIQTVQDTPASVYNVHHFQMQSIKASNVPKIGLQCTPAGVYIARHLQSHLVASGASRGAQQ